MSWTEDRVALLKKMWTEGRTAAEIAKALGGPFTRNAVIGKAHRLKLSSRLSPITVPPRKAEPTSAPRRASNDGARIRVAPPPPVKIVTKGIKLVDLKERMCRWPLGDPKDPDFNFCGCNTVPGLPYCADHGRMAYQVNKRSRLFSMDDDGHEEIDEDMIKAMIGR